MGGTAAGPLIYATGLDWLGTYTPALLATAVLAALLSGAAALLDEDRLLQARPRRSRLRFLE